MGIKGYVIQMRYRTGRKLSDYAVGLSDLRRVVWLLLGCC